MKAEYGHAVVCLEKNYYLFKSVTHGQPLYIQQHDLYLNRLADGFQGLHTCDVIVLNTALFWEQDARKRNIGRVFGDGLAKRENESKERQNR
jgi:hypothetical protein